MMKLARYTALAPFREAALESLHRDEVLHNLPIGILNRLTEPLAEDIYMAMVTGDAGEPLLIALQTPPNNLILSVVGTFDGVEPYEALASNLAEAGIHPPGVLGVTGQAGAFAELYAKRIGARAETKKRLRFYQLRAVSGVPLMGALRPASEGDMHFLPYWYQAFSGDTHASGPPLDPDYVRQVIGRGWYFLLWHEGQPVCLAGSTRKMPHGRSVGPVYTPPYFRGRGYATAAVAMLSQRLLDEGCEYCVLTTDLANPTSNSIYQKIGYRAVCDLEEVAFRPT